MKVDSCPVCGQYHSAYECEAMDWADGQMENFEKIKKQREQRNDVAPRREKEKNFRRPPMDKSLKWEYTK